jgi:hypothetical protein
MRILVNVHLFGHLYRYVILCDSGFYLQQFPIFFLSLGMYITLLPIRLTNAIIIFGTFIHAHNHVIVSLIILANSFFSFFFSYSTRVYMSLTLAVVQYERSTVRHHHFLVSPTPTVPANKRTHITSSKTILVRGVCGL